MKACGCCSVEVGIRWYYRPENTETGRLPYHGAKELLLTDHFHTRNAHDIKGKCVVHSVKDYSKLDHARPEDFFCRFKYFEDTDSFTPQRRHKLYCSCRRPYNPDLVMLRCGNYLDRFHPDCIGMTIEEARELVHFICPSCVKENAPEDTNWTGASSVIPGVPIDTAPTGDAEDDDFLKKCAKRKADTTLVKRKRQKLNPMVMQVSRLIDLIASSKKKVEDEITEHLQRAVDAGAKEGSDEHFMATKLFRKQEYRAVFRSFGTDEGRMAWLKRMYEDRKKN